MTRPGIELWSPGTLANTLVDGNFFDLYFSNSDSDGKFKEFYIETIIL